MAAWDALARAAGVPLCVLLGGTTGAVPAYNSNGLWLHAPAAVAEEAVALREEGGFAGLKLRLGRERLADDLATLNAVRQAARRSLHFDGYGRLAVDSATPARATSTWPRDPPRPAGQGLRPGHARLHANRRHNRLAARRPDRRRRRHPDLDPPLP